MMASSLVSFGDPRYPRKLSVNPSGMPPTRFENSARTYSLTSPAFSSSIRWNICGFRSVRATLWMKEKRQRSMRAGQSTLFPTSSSHFPRIHAMAALWACLSSSVRSSVRRWSFHLCMFEASNM
jgi:hypothetical protein